MGNIVEKPRSMIRTVYLPNQETVDMGATINNLKSENDSNREHYESILRELRDDKRRREEE